MFFKSSVLGLKIQENIQKKLAVSLKKISKPLFPKTEIRLVN